MRARSRGLPVGVGLCPTTLDQSGSGFARPPLTNRGRSLPDNPRLIARARAGERLDELLELARGPALECAAVAFVRGDDGVAVVPVQVRLGVQPERAAGLLRHLREHVGAWVAAVGAG